MIGFFNGCSYVWGDELLKPQESRFSRLVSDELGVDEVNPAIRGASNDRIYRTTMDFLQFSEEKPSFVILVWSGVDRFEYLDHDHTTFDMYDPMYLQCSPSRLDNKEFKKNQKLLERYIATINIDKFTSIKTISYMCSVQHLCEVMNIPLLQFQFAYRHRDSLNKILETIPRSTPERLFMEYYEKKLGYLKEYSRYGLTNDNDLLSMSMRISDVVVRKNYYGHPLEKSQILFKDFMLSQLRKHYDFRIQ